MKKYYLLFVYSFFSLSLFAQPEVGLSEIATGFDRPVNIKNAGDDRLFVVEQDGLIQILNADGTINAAPFLDIDNIVGDINNGGDERGLLGLAFHPNYSNNGYFYVNYINNSGNTVVSRFNVSATDFNLADPNSEQIILTINQPFSNHNGGDMNFGADGYLYIATGDGGSGGDPQDNGQDLNTLLGKMLRIDVDSASPYAIPSDNPFANDGNNATLDEIWAYGLRNPWKFSFDSQTNDIWIADVGQSQYEEINIAASTDAGLNYGWRCYEGNSVFNSTGCPASNTLTFPVGEYSHTGSGDFKCSVTGGYRYRGNDNPDMIGWYFFADYCSDEIGYLEHDGANWNLTLTGPFGGNNWSSFGEDINGELYICGLNSGTVYKIIDTNLSIDDQFINTFKLYPNPAKDMVTFSFGNNYTAKQIIFYNVQGKVIKTIENFDSSLFQFSTKNLDKGLYIVEVLNANNNSTFKKLILN